MAIIEKAKATNRELAWKDESDAFLKMKNSINNVPLLLYVPKIPYDAILILFTNMLSILYR